MATAILLNAARPRRIYNASWTRDAQQEEQWRPAERTRKEVPTR